MLDRLAGVAQPRLLDALRAALAFTQAAMVCTTWSLWSSRDLPANLGWIGPLEAVPWNWVLLASLVLVVLRPREGIVVHVAVLALAVAGDELRLQPEFASVAILLVATGPWRLSRTLGWAALSSLWLWAGIAKALSAGFEPVADKVAAGLGLGGLAGPAVWAIPLVEVLLGVAAAIPATRRWAGWAGAVLHLLAPATLDLSASSPIFWWNLGLATASIVLLALAAPSPDPRPAPSPVAAGALVAVLFAYPATAYAEVVDPYLGHHLYSGDVPTAVVCTPERTCSDFAVLATRGSLGVPIPPSPRTFRRWFLAGCSPGEELRVDGLVLRAPLDDLPAAGEWTTTCPAPT